MQRAGAAKGHQGEIARVEAALDRHQADRVGHVGLGNRNDAQGRLLQSQAQRRGDGGHGRSRQRGVKLARAVEEKVAVEAPGHEVGIGHRRGAAALRVARRARIGAGTLRSDAQRSAAVDHGDGAAAGADRDHVEGRCEQRVGSDRTAMRQRRVAIGDQRHVLLDLSGQVLCRGVFVAQAAQQARQNGGHAGHPVGGTGGVQAHAFHRVGQGAQCQAAVRAVVTGSVALCVASMGLQA